MLKGFKEFVLRGNVVELAVAVVMGAAFGAVIASFVADLLTPLIAAAVGAPDFSNLTFTLNGSIFRYGRFINALLSFLFVAFAVYFAVVLPLGKLARRRQEPVPPPAPEKPEEVVGLLAQIRDLLKRAEGSAGAHP